MTLAWTPWLPEDAAVPALAQRLLAEEIESWSRDWFAGSAVRTVGQLSRVAAPRSELRKAIWHGCDEGVAIGLPLAGTAALGALVLDVTTASGNRNADDLKLLDTLGKECLDGLKLRLAQLLMLGKPDWRSSDIGQAEGAVYRLEIGLAARAVTIQLELGKACFIRFAQGLLPEPAAAAALGSGVEALARIPVSLSALLGSCSLTLAELSGLAADDVIVLERAMEESLPLAIGGVPLARGSCTVVEAGDGLALKIIQAPAS
ncbi:MAG TPA: FliM/FliN family flagellar motor C-terminal domain-containing protein [Sphingomonas sp.]|nr:FliM/FliN family flagellar motor C-terminal domain-containing protein [Sphingomonas sp.]